MANNPVLRVFSIVAMLAVILAGAATAVAAGDLPGVTMSPEEILAAQAKEPPLERKDIDDYIALLPSILAMQGVTEAEFDAGAFQGAIEAQGVTPIRFGVLMSKVSLATMRMLGIDLGPQLEAFPEALRPSEAEVKLVEDNWDRIQKAYTDFQSAQAAD
ncbi:MAG: hypothetical protein LBJ46_00335 [Planctomycetota bacterium]|jgi:hypothetical protein|nr:hypothetical protein [Planctomycetota bacterium]